MTIRGSDRTGKTNFHFKIGMVSYAIISQLLLSVSILTSSYLMGQAVSSVKVGSYSFVNRSQGISQPQSGMNKLIHATSYKSPSENGAHQIHYKNGKLLANIILKDDYVYSYEEFHDNGKRALKINFARGLYKSDYLVLISKMIEYTDENINQFISTLNRYYDDRAYASIAIPSKAQLDLDQEQYLAAWDSIRFVCAGIISGECIISNYDVYGHIADSIIYSEGKEIFKAKTAYYETVKMNKVSEKKIYQNGTLSKSYVYETTGRSFEIKNYFKNGKVESGGVVRRGKRVGKWSFYNQKGRVLKIEKYRKGTLVSTVYNP